MKTAAAPSGRTVCIVQQSADLDGSAVSGLLLADGLKAAGYRTAVIFGREGPIIESYRAAGHAVSVVTHLNWLRTASLPRFLKHLWMQREDARRLEVELGRIAPDLVYLNSVVSLAGGIAARRLRLPVIWHLRELFESAEGEMRIPGLFRGAIPWILRRYSDRQVVNSRAVGQDLLRHHARSASVVPNAGGPVYDALPGAPDPLARARFGLAPEGLVIGVPGTLRPIKGHPFFFEALPEVLRGFPDVQVVVSGDGEEGYRELLHRMVRTQNLVRQVHFLGSLEDMAAFYRVCGVVCVPSRTEGFGRIVIEAFASGIPVVASRAGGIAEIVTHGEDGLLVDHGDAAALAAALQALLGSADLRARLARRGRERYDREYRTEFYQQRLAALVNETLEGSAARA